MTNAHEEGQVREGRGHHEGVAGLKAHNGNHGKERQLRHRVRLLFDFLRDGGALAGLHCVYLKRKGRH